MFFDAFHRPPWGKAHGTCKPADVLDFCEHYLQVCGRLLEDWPHRLLRLNPIELGPEGTVDCILRKIRNDQHAPGPGSSIMPDITAWRPVAVESIQQHLGAFRNWALAGGESLDWILGESTRAHGDTDIGVFRSDLKQCLDAIGRSRVFLCSPSGSLLPWDGAEVPAAVHDIWITDPPAQNWILQIMVYDDAGDFVIYRRDPRIRWRKASHSLSIRGVSVVNPLVTLLFKTHKAKLEPKDGQDIQRLIERFGKEPWTTA